MPEARVSIGPKPAADALQDFVSADLLRTPHPGSCGRSLLGESASKRRLARGCFSGCARSALACPPAARSRFRASRLAQRASAIKGIRVPVARAITEPRGPRSVVPVATRCDVPVEVASLTPGSAAVSRIGSWLCWRVAMAAASSCSVTTGHPLDGPVWMTVQNSWALSRRVPHPVDQERGRGADAEIPR